MHAVTSDRLSRYTVELHIYWSSPEQKLLLWDTGVSRVVV